jgi:hypothetical protein
LRFHFVVISVGAGYDSIIPDAPGAESHPSTSDIAEKVSKSVEQYLDAMEKVNDALVHYVKRQVKRQNPSTACAKSAASFF